MNIKEIKQLKKLKISINPCEMRNTDYPDMPGMPLCIIYKGKEVLEQITGNSQEEIADKVNTYLKKYLKNI